MGAAEHRLKQARRDNLRRLQRPTGTGAVGCHQRPDVSLRVSMTIPSGGLKNALKDDRQV